MATSISYRGGVRRIILIEMDPKNPVRAEYAGIALSEHGGSPPQPSMAVHPVSPPAVYNPNLPQMGSEQWRYNWYDLFTFCKASDFCCTTWCFSWFTLSHIANYTNAFRRFMNIRGVVIVLLVVLYLQFDIRAAQEKRSRVSLQNEDIDGDGTTDYEIGILSPDTGFFPYYLYILITLIVWKLRYTVRAQRGITGSDSADCCLSTCCTPCVTFQMAYQIWRDPVVEPGGLLTELHKVEPVDLEEQQVVTGSAHDGLSTTLLSGSSVHSHRG